MSDDCLGCTLSNNKSCNLPEIEDKIKSISEQNDAHIVINLHNGHLLHWLMTHEDERVRNLIVEYFSDIDGIDWTLEKQEYKPLPYACKNGYTEIAKLALKYERVEANMWDNHCIRYACEGGYTEIVKMLLATEGVDPADHNGDCLRQAFNNSHLEVFELLAADPRLDVSVFGNDLVREAAKSEEKLPFLVTMLKNQLLCPTDWSNTAIHNAIKADNVEAIRLLNFTGVLMGVNRDYKEYRESAIKIGESLNLSYAKGSKQNALKAGEALVVHGIEDLSRVYDDNRLSDDERDVLLNTVLRLVKSGKIDKDSDIAKKASARNLSCKVAKAIGQELGECNTMSHLN